MTLMDSIHIIHIVDYYLCTPLTGPVLYRLCVQATKGKILHSEYVERSLTLYNGVVMTTQQHSCK